MSIVTSYLPYLLSGTGGASIVGIVQLVNGLFNRRKARAEVELTEAQTSEAILTTYASSNAEMRSQVTWLLSTVQQMRTENAQEIGNLKERIIELTAEVAALREENAALITILKDNGIPHPFRNRKRPEVIKPLPPTPATTPALAVKEAP